MKIIAILNQKGGVAKTTSAVHIARSLQLAGYKTGLVDADVTQGSAVDWSAAGGGEKLKVVGELNHGLSVFKNDGYEYVVIDGAPQATTLAAQCINVADIVIIPVTPSALDVWASGDLVDLIKAKMAAGGHLKSAFLLSKVVSGTTLSIAVRDALHGFGLPVLRRSIAQRTIYAKTMGDGTTALDAAPSSVASFDFDAVVEEILKM